MAGLAIQQRELVFDQTELGEYMLTLLSKPTPANLSRVEFLAAGEHASVALYYPASGAAHDFLSTKRPRSAPAPIGLPHLKVTHHLGGPQIYLPHMVDGRRVGELILVADDWEVRENLPRNVVTTGIVALVTLLFSGVMAGTLAHRTLRPLHVLNRAIERERETRNFGSKVTVSYEDEIGRLTENVNALLGDLEGHHAVVRRTCGLSDRRCRPCPMIRRPRIRTIVSSRLQTRR